MNREAVEAKYQAQGLATEYAKDQPGKVYPAHAHEKTFLYTLGGYLQIRTNNGPWHRLEVGEEFVVEENQLHEALAGSDGWEHVAAWDAKEAKKFKH